MPLKALAVPAVYIALFLALPAGAALRFAHLDDIEYKVDEAWTFHAAQRWLDQGEATALGAPSSQNVRHMGLSAWIFYPLAWGFGAEEPTQLACGVAAVNVLALSLLVLVVHLFVPAGEREIWLWAVVLAAVNPHQVFMSRKIWAVCLFPLFTVGFIACWLRRVRVWGAFGWGLLGAILAQIHLAAGLYVAAIWLADRIFRKAKTPFTAWLLGTLLGCVGMAPWLYYVLGDRTETPRSNVLAIHRPLHMRFWSYWTTEPFSLGIEHYLKEEKSDFLAGPTVAEQPLFINAAAYGGCIAAAGLLMTAGLNRWRRAGWSLLSQGEREQTSTLVQAGGFGYGLILTFTFLPVFRHYLIVTFPVMFVWAASLGLPANGSDSVLRRGRIFLAVLAIGSLWLSLQLLRYIHDRGEAPGTYAKTYRLLVEEQGARPPQPGPPRLDAHPLRRCPLPLP